jgi:hypothetical protein
MANHQVHQGVRFQGREAGITPITNQAITDFPEARKSL